jgi:tRNA-splicing ligase RtcB (3'-phosphate/5'-hydroxy nucleic acid ligase)
LCYKYGIEEEEHMNVINGRVPIFSWCPDIDDKTLVQMERLVALPFVSHAALMPDAHLGNSMPIGGVLACNGVVIPDAVGTDIGCGMCTVKTSLKASDFSTEARWRYLDRIEAAIPVGFEHNDDRRIRLLTDVMEDKYLYDYAKAGIDVTSRNPIGDIKKAYFSQIGTLGGGNHMAEVDVDADDNVWILIHSGSRNMGTKICGYFSELASAMNRKYWSSVPEDISFLPTDSDEGRDYLIWMDFALSFAFRNRQVMLGAMQEAFLADYPGISFDKPINIHHNYASQERHFGKDVWVHRKGATLAADGTMGIIPGSMGTASYVVRGKGNQKSLNSCSHGAGRKVGRQEFNRANNTEEALAAIEKSMEGVVYRKFRKDINRKGKETGMLDVSECPLAYKDIDEVIANEADLVEPVVRMRPIVVMKG